MDKPVSADGVPIKSDQAYQRDSGMLPRTKLSGCVEYWNEHEVVEML